jgi:hypothetical protein
LEALVSALDKAPATIDEEFAGDLRHLVGRLEETLNDLTFELRETPDVNDQLDAISQTLHKVRKCTEGTANISTMRQYLDELKGQISSLQSVL